MCGHSASASWSTRTLCRPSATRTFSSSIGRPGPLPENSTIASSRRSWNPPTGHDPEWPRPALDAKRRNSRRERAGAHQGARELGLDVRLEGDDAEFRQVLRAPMRCLEESMLAPEPETGTECLEHCLLAARLPRHTGRAQRRIEVEPGAMQTGGECLGVAQLRLAAAAVSTDDLQIDERKSRQALEPGDAGLDGDGERHPGFAMRGHHFAVERREPAAQIVDAGTIATAKARAFRFEPLQLVAGLGAIAAEEARDRGDDAQPSVIRVQALGAGQRQPGLRRRATQRPHRRRSGAASRRQARARGLRSMSGRSRRRAVPPGSHRRRRGRPG